MCCAVFVLYSLLVIFYLSIRFLVKKPQKILSRGKQQELSLRDSNETPFFITWGVKIRITNLLIKSSVTVRTLYGR